MMKKFLWVSVISTFLLVFVIFSFFFHIWSSQGDKESKVIQEVQNRLPIIMRIDKVYYFAGDQVYYVMFAKDLVGDSLLVWANDHIVRYRYLKYFLEKERIEKLVLNSEKTVTIKRITPGVIEEEHLIYEVLYEDQKKRLGYSYYDLQTGKLLRKYRLGVTVRN